MDNEEKLRKIKNPTEEEMKEAKEFVNEILFNISKDINNKDYIIDPTKMFIEQNVDKCKTVNELIDTYKTLRNGLYAEIIKKELIKYNVKELNINYNNFRNYNHFLYFVNNELTDLIGKHYQDRLKKSIDEIKSDFKFQEMDSDIQAIFIKKYSLKADGKDFYNKYKKNIHSGKSININEIKDFLYNYSYIIKNKLIEAVHKFKTDDKVEFKNKLIKIIGIKSTNKLYTLLENEEFIKSIVKQDAKILEICSDDIVDDLSLMINLYKGNKNTIKYLRKLKTNKYFALKIYNINNDITIFDYFDESIIHDIILRIVEKDENILEFANDKLLNDSDFMLKCIRKNYRAIDFISTNLENNLKFMIKAKLSITSRIKSFTKQKKYC